MRLIDADALIGELQKDEERFDKEAEDCRKNSRNYTDCYMQAMSSRADGIRDAIIEIHDAPTIDAVSVMRGAWIERIGGISKELFYQCSKCYGEVDTDEFDYCPWCGAKMKGADDE